MRRRPPDRTVLSGDRVRAATSAVSSHVTGLGRRCAPMSRLPDRLDAVGGQERQQVGPEVDDPAPEA
jgi:hypothetical protein